MTTQKCPLCGLDAALVTHERLGRTVWHSYQHEGGDVCCAREDKLCRTQVVEIHQEGGKGVARGVEKLSGEDSTAS